MENNLSVTKKNLFCSLYFYFSSARQENRSRSKIKEKNVDSNPGSSLTSDFWQNNRTLSFICKPPYKKLLQKIKSTYINSCKNLTECSHSMFPLYPLLFPKRDSNVPSILTLTQKEQRLSFIRQKIPFKVVSV